MIQHQKLLQNLQNSTIQETHNMYVLAELYKEECAHTQCQFVAGTNCNKNLLGYKIIVYKNL